MAGTRRHGINAAIWMDTSSAGTMSAGTLAAGTANLTLVTSMNTWSFDQSRDFVDTTSFGDTSKNDVAGLSDGTGSIAGQLDFGDNNIWNSLASSTERALMIFPDATNNATTWVAGKAYYSPKYGGGVTASVTRSLDFRAGPTGLIWYHP